MSSTEMNSTFRRVESAAEAMTAEDARTQNASNARIDMGEPPASAEPM
jgi:hypothetical protein